MNAASIARWLVRLSGLALLVLGAAIWTGSFDALIPIHMLIGIVLVLSLWTLAARAGAPTPMVVLAVAWGVLLAVLGVTQEGILPGGAHWIVQVVHLLVGVAAIGEGEALGARTARSSRASGTAA